MLIKGVTLRDGRTTLAFMPNRTRAELLREEIDAADRDTLRILENRAKLARELGLLRKDEPSVFRGIDRSQLGALLDQSSGDLPKENLVQIFTAIHAACMSLERPIRVAFVGQQGALGHVAARQVFGASVQVVACESAVSALDELARGRVDYALVPYEASQEGHVFATISALTHSDLMVSGMHEIAAAVSLMSNGCVEAQIEKVYATPNYRTACEAVLRSRVPHAVLIDVRSPMMACQLAAEDRSGAAIVCEQAGVLVGLSPVIANIGDRRDMRMRYAVVGARPSPRSGKDTTSLVLTLHDKPGALLAVLGEFEKRGLNVKNIMSRPAPGEAWDYVFYIDVEGHVTDQSIVSALDDIRTRTKFFKVIGSYPTQS